MRRMYYLKRQEFKEKEKGLNNFRAYLLETVPTVQIIPALQQPTLCHMMVALRGLSAIELKDEYKALLGKKNAQIMQLWLTELEFIVKKLRPKVYCKIFMPGLSLCIFGIGFAT